VLSMAYADMGARATLLTVGVLCRLERQGARMLYLSGLNTASPNKAKVPKAETLPPVSAFRHVELAKAERPRV